MKRILALILALLMMFPFLFSCGKSSKKDTETQSQGQTETQLGDPNPDAKLTVTPATLTLSIKGTYQLSANYVPKYDSDGNNLKFLSSDDSIATVTPDGTVVGIKAGTAVITVQDARGDLKATCTVTVLGTSTTLKGTIHMPPVDSQGNIGSCAHESVTYAQFTIAVSQYLNYHKPELGWNPSSGELRYLFSPKFTFNFAGAGTEYAYNILKDHGCLTEDYSRFYHSGEASLSGPSTAPYKETASWDVSQGLMDLALTYRLTGFEEIDYTGTYSGNLTSAGQGGIDLMNRVKKAVTDGNAVVICGWSSYWNYDRLSKDGDMGKKGEDCIWSAGNPNNGSGDGNHAVTIVGYDDNVEMQVGGITLKGAFQVLNSWGSGYCNDGYIWMMYDAFNEKSEFDILNDPRSESSTVFSAVDGLKFMPLKSTKNNFIYDFNAVGEVTLDGKTYKTYTIYDPISKKYLGYNASNIQLVSNLNGNLATQWAIIPYADVVTENPNEAYKDSVLLYAFMRPGASTTLKTDNFFASANYYQEQDYTFKSPEDGNALCFMSLSGMKSIESEKFSSAIQLSHSFVTSSSKEVRTSTIYRFSFIDWRNDIMIGVPGLRVEVEVSTTTRENFYLDLLRIDASGNVLEHRPWLFQYTLDGLHNEYMEEGKRNQMSFSGVPFPTEAESGFFTLSYLTMSAFTKDSGPENYLWGVRITGKDSCIKSMRLIAPDGKVLSTITLSEEYNRVETEPITQGKTSKEYYFDLGGDLHTFAADGKFYMKNKGTGKYVGYKATLFKNTTLDGDMDMIFTFTTDSKTGEFILYDENKETRLDIYQKEIAEGVVVKLNNSAIGRANTQRWTMVTNNDNTVSFYLTDYPEYYFGYDAKATGPSKYVLTKNKDSDFCKWILEGAGDAKEMPEISFNGTTATYKIDKPADYKGTTATLRVTGSDGSLVSETAVTFTGNAVNAPVSGLKSGETYVFVLTNGLDNITVNYIVKCP